MAIMGYISSRIRDIERALDGVGRAASLVSGTASVCWLPFVGAVIGTSAERGRSIAERRGVREGAREYERDARDGAREATRVMPRAAAREVGRASGLGCATSKCLPRLTMSLVDCTLMETLDAPDPLECV